MYENQDSQKAHQHLAPSVLYTSDMASLNFQTQTVMKKVGMSSKATTREACGGQDFSRQKGSTPGCRGLLICGKLWVRRGTGKFLVYRGDWGQVLEGIVCSPTFQKGGRTQILKISKRGGT